MAVPEEQLPLLLPDTDNFRPSGTPESPLAVIEDWVNTVDPASGRPARRETSTMPQARKCICSADRHARTCHRNWRRITGPTLFSLGCGAVQHGVTPACRGYH